MTTESDIKNLWKRMAAIYGHRWVSSFGESDEDGTWLRGLQDVPASLIGQGLEKCIKFRNDDWPPSLPEFRRLCIGIPSVEIACEDALRGNNDSLSRAIRSYIGSWNLEHDSRESLLRQARSVYDKACAVVYNEKVLNIPESMHKMIS